MPRRKLAARTSRKDTSLPGLLHRPPTPAREQKPIEENQNLIGEKGHQRENREGFPSEKKNWSALGRETGQRDLRGKGPVPLWGSWETGFSPRTPRFLMGFRAQGAKGILGDKAEAVSMDPVEIIVLHNIGPA